jgi:hypothetical protein
MPIPFQCPFCGLQTLVPEQYAGQSGPCASCGKRITIPLAAGYAPPRPLDQDPIVRMLIPIGRSGWAIAAGYAGLFSLLCIPGPIALILGIVAIRDIKRHPEKHGMGRAIFGLVMGSLGSLGLAFALQHWLWNALRR